ncbi:MAG TPA: ABC transporter ATP-binding protein, partial [Clostridia bacterium]
MIVLENVTVRYGEKTVLDKFSQSFAENTLHVIIGRSGCGKTTMLRTIAGLIIPSGGRVLYNNNVIKKPIRDIFMMHQGYTNYPWKTCLDNILFPIELQGHVTNKQKEEAIELLGKVGLYDYQNKYPYELSGGMKQRLALARTLMSKPPVILMDEPLSALDFNTRSEMQKLVMDLHVNT